MRIPDKSKEAAAIRYSGFWLEKKFKFKSVRQNQFLVSWSNYTSYVKDVFNNCELLTIV